MALTTRARRWLRRWRPLLPVLVAELVILLGFGALLPVLPLFVVEHGVDVPTLGLILAAWPMAKLVAEPVFGYLSDRTSRKPFLIGGAVVLAIAVTLPIFFTSAAALFVLRAVAGAAAGAYDPAARGMIMDATREGERGEAFGIYSSFQMGGFLLGPVIGAFGAALGGGMGFPFLLTGVLTMLAAALLMVTLPGQVSVVGEPADGEASHPVGPRDEAPHALAPTEIPFAATTVAAPLVSRADDGSAPPAPLRGLLNGSLLAALVIHLGFSLSFGIYEVIWSLYLTDLGASIEWVGLTFMIFGLPMMLLSPLAGRLVDRHGGLRFVMVSGAAIVVAGVAYSLASEPLFPSLVVVPVEAVAEAFLMPALFALLAAGTPAGRNATAQGIFGAVGTVGLIVAIITGGVLWDHDRDWPFYFFVIGGTLSLGIGLLIYRRVPGAFTRREPAAIPVEAG